MADSRSRSLTVDTAPIETAPPSGVGSSASRSSSSDRVLAPNAFTFTGICQGELCESRKDTKAFETGDVQVLAISCDSRHE